MELVASLSSLTFVPFKLFDVVATFEVSVVRRINFPSISAAKVTLLATGSSYSYVAPVCGLLDADFIGERRSDSLGWAPLISCLVRSCMGSSCLLPFVLIFVFMFVFGRGANYLVLSSPIHRSFCPLTGGRVIPLEGCQVPWGWLLMTDAPNNHLPVPSTARYTIAAHLSLGLGIFIEVVILAVRPVKVGPLAY